MSISYKKAGVDIEAGNLAVKRIKSAVESTFSSSVLTSLGNFAALYDLKPIMDHYRHPLLVQSIDGVGTKISVASKMRKFSTIGIDLVSATVNDILVLGAKPLTLLDYIANDKLDPNVIEQLLQGMVQACRAHEIALVGGEMAEMPGVYLSGEHDVAGIITGVVEKDKLILGHDITPGDVVLAFPSNGLHTNGYSLARKILFELHQYDVNSRIDSWDLSLGETLLLPHINYLQPVQALLAANLPIKGMAHITGGGVLENIPRVLPQNCAVEIEMNACPIPPIFSLLQKLGELDQAEMYRTFNMGIGYVLIVAQSTVTEIKQCLTHLSDFPLYEIGRVITGNQTVRLV